MRAASDLVDLGYGSRTVLVHLLAVPRARVAALLGERQRTEHILNQAIRDASDRDTVAGTDELWLAAAQQAGLAGDRGRLERCLREAEVVAGTLATDRALTHSLLIQAAVEPGSGGAALRAVRELGQPFELAAAIEYLVRIGAAEPRLLREAYEILGQADALLTRARLRALMREHGCTIPDRQAVVGEIERLLTELVAQGFGNQQIAVILGASRRSVESRLSRLFSRSGHRSRLELAMSRFEARRAGLALPDGV